MFDRASNGRKGLVEEMIKLLLILSVTLVPFAYLVFAWLRLVDEIIIDEEVGFR